ncbi:hypothetical protein OsI_17469 [Oryza sativa Indica Group]|uniref:Uncharacterized protein n=1 Tax=Oryza sativa subsp. indica TaxID=39946 RepID=B8AUH7_ORYSI|nr:hypothetical protein OsI_17469 [Oryza sativa Indica Group]
MDGHDGSWIAATCPRMNLRRGLEAVLGRAQLIQIWIAQGFVEESSEKLEQKGWKYLAELVNSGFLQQVESTRFSSEYGVMHDLMHDLAQKVSQTEYATIDGSECTELAPSIRHLSIVTDSAYRKEKYRNISRNEVFEKRLMKVKSRIGKFYTSPVSENVTEESGRTLPRSLRKYYHLQVLDIGYRFGIPRISNDINNLLSLRHLVAYDEVCSSIANIGKMTSLQELGNFIVQNNLSGFEVTQLKSMNKLVQLSVSQLENVRTQEEACGAKLKDKQHLEKLHLSWKDAWNRYDSDESYEDEYGSDMNIETEGEELSVGDANGAQSLQHHSNISSELASSEVLEGLEPHHGLKYLRISGYNGSTSPTWLPSSLTCLQTLHLEKCGKWQILPLERLGLLVKLVLIKMRNATELSIPSLEELVLIALPSLNTCSCTSIRNLNSSLKELGNFIVQNNLSGFEVTQLKSMNKLVQLSVSQLENVRTQEEACGAKLKDKQHLEKLHLSWKDAWNGYDSDESYEDEYGSDMNIETEGEELSVGDANGAQSLQHHSNISSELASSEVLEGLEPHHGLKYLRISGSLPPSSIVSKLSIGKVSTLPTVRGSSSGTLIIGLHPDEVDDDDGLEDSDQLKTLDDKVLLFHNLRFLTSLAIYGCRNLATISIESLRQLVCLKSLELYGCPKLFSSDVPPELTCEYMSGANHSALPSLECLYIEDCGITGKWLSLMLQHVQALQELSLEDCQQITRLSIGEEENSQPNLMSAMEDPSLGYPDRDELLRLPLNLISSLKKVSITYCYDLTFYGSKVDFAGFTSLEELVISRCPKLVSFLAHNDGNDEQSNGRWLLPLSLGKLEINYVDSLKTLQLCFPGNLTRLKKLVVLGNQSLTSLQLHSCTALQELIIRSCESLNSLEGLQLLGNLRLLCAHRCLSGHEEDGMCILPQSLEEIYICEYSQERLQLCFPGNLTCLKKLVVLGNQSLTSLQLHSCTALQELIIQSCESLNSLEGLQWLGNLRLLQAHRCLSGYGENGRCILPQSLEELYIREYSQETLQPCFPGNLTSLKKLEVQGSQKPAMARQPQVAAGTQMPQWLWRKWKVYPSQSLEGLYIREYSQEILQPCFQTNLTCLKRLEVSGTGSFKSLELQSCTALEHLKIEGCSSLATLEGLRFLHTLRHLKVHRCPRLPPYFESLSGQGYELCPRLERLEINYPSILTTSFCKNLTSLQYLELCSHGLEMERLTDEEERALQLLTSLQELRFNCCYNLVDLPTGLHNLPSLKRLEIWNCGSIARPLEKGLPPSLEELAIVDCSNELAQRCRLLASKRKVKINQRYVN